MQFMSRLPSAIALGLAINGLELAASHAQALRPPFPRVHVLAQVGKASGAGNEFTDIAITGGLRVSRAAVRLRVGSLVHLDGCDAISPTKCGAGAHRYYDATIAIQAGRDPARVGGWTVALGPGMLRTGSRAYIGAAVGRDLALGRRGLVRIEVHGRHIFDHGYRLVWHEPHRQVGLRVGLGLWSGFD